MPLRSSATQEGDRHDAEVGLLDRELFVATLGRPGGGDRYNSYRHPSGKGVQRLRSLATPAGDRRIAPQDPYAGKDKLRSSVAPKGDCESAVDSWCS